MTSKTMSAELLAKGTESLKQEKVSTAKDYFVAAVKQDPENSEAYHYLGLIFSKENQVKPALECLSRAVKAQPGNISYLLNLANLQSKSGYLKEAISSYLLYLQKKPNSPDVLFYLACTLMQAKKYDDAIPVFEESIKQDPKVLTPYMTLAELQYKLLRYNDALSIYERALDLGFEDKQLFLSSYKLYVEKGDIIKAKALLEKALITYPKVLVFWYHLNKIDKESLNKRLESTLKDFNVDELSEEEKIYYYFLEASLYRAEGNVEAEISSLLTAHKLYSELAVFDKEASFFLDDLPNQLTQKIPSDTKTNSSLETMSPVFIIGVPRSGSTLVENIICSGKGNIVKGEEIGALANSFYKLKEKEFTWADFEKATQKVLSEAGVLNNEQRFSDKSLENIFLVDYIFTMFPKAKIIYCDRSPMSSLISILRNNMTYLPWAHNLDSILKYFDNCYKAIAHWNEKYADKIYTISYEQLINNPEAETKRLFEFCDITWDKSCLDFYMDNQDHCRTASNIQVREKINDKSLSIDPKYKAYFQEYSEPYAWLK